MSIESQPVERLLPRKGLQTAAYKIFHYYFPCRIQNIHRFTAQSLTEVGMVSSGNKAVDRVMALQYVDVTLPIAGMAEYLSQGVNVQIVDPNDTAKIYRIIKQHLDDWFMEAQSNLHCMESPDEDLRKLDDLAAEIYPFARYFMADTPFHGRLTDTLASIILARGGSKRGIESEKNAELKNARNAVTPAHTPMADTIAKLTQARREPWLSKTHR